jgi:hypothetical protein
VLVHEIQHHIYYAAIAVHFAMWVATCRHASNIKIFVSKRMISRCVAAWGSWLRVQKFLLHQRQVMRRVTLKWQLKSIRTIHAGWIKYVASAASIKAIAVIVLRRSVKRTIGHFIFSWMVYVSEHKRLARTAHKVINRWGKLLTSVPYRSWHTNMKEKKRIAHCISKVIVGIRKKLLWSSFTKIEHVMTASRNSKYRIDQGASQWAQVEVSNATVTIKLMGKMFITWHVQQKDTGGRQRRGQKAICKYLCMILRNYFESWMRKTAHFQQLRNRCKATVLRLSSHAMSKAYSRWTAVRIENVRIESIGARVMIKWSRLELLQPLLAWRLHMS